MKFVDLSVTINKKIPVYPGDPVVKIDPSGILERDGYEDHYVSIGTHVGTHIDGPRHMIAGGKRLSEFEIDTFIGNGVCVAVLDKKFDLEKLKQTEIHGGDIVLFYTGMSKVYFEKQYFEDYPAIPEDIATYLIDQKIKIVGVDTCSADHPPFIVHKMFLGSEILIIENLSNLEHLVGKQFKIYALPIKLEIDGGPARVIAEVIE